MSEAQKAFDKISVDKEFDFPLFRDGWNAALDYLMGCKMQGLRNEHWIPVGTLEKVRES